MRNNRGSFPGLKILLTGKSGQVGSELKLQFSTLGDVVATGRECLDLCDERSLREIVRTVRPDLIINAAAYTQVDTAESDPTTAMQINGIAPGVLAEECLRLGSTLLHFSTDYVFDGTKLDPYIEDDVPNPINVYGSTKLAGENAIRQIGCSHFIFRTTWIYGTTGHNFLLTMLKFASQKEMRVVNDQMGAPTWCRDLATAVFDIVYKLYDKSEKNLDGFRSKLRETGGTYHLTASGKTSWFGFAQFLMDRFLQTGLIQQAPILIPIHSADYTSAAPRPRNSVLSNAKFARLAGYKNPEWDLAASRCIELLAQSNRVN